MDQSHLEIFSTPLGIREMQIETTELLPHSLEWLKLERLTLEVMEQM